MKLSATLLSLVVLFGSAGRADSVPVFVRIPTPPFATEPVAPNPVQPNSVQSSRVLPKPAPPQSVFGSAPLRAPLAPTCGAAAANPTPAQPLPSGVSGRVGFYAAIYDQQLRPVRALALGQINTLFPLASAFKSLVVRAALQEVDAGRLSLQTLMTASPAQGSPEAYLAGRNTVAALAQRALERGDHAASDLLYLGLGPEKIARAVYSLSSCTALLHTTKAWWAAQAGLMPEVLPDSVRRAVSLPFDERLKWASRFNHRAQQFTGPQVEAALGSYFHGPAYAPQLEWALQNTSTPQSYADLLARILSADDLKAPTRQLFRSWLAKSCCQPKQPQLKAVYWGHEAGSGWRTLTLSGYAELASGQRLAYAYFNDGSGTLKPEDMERQIPALVDWIDAALWELARSPLLR